MDSRSTTFQASKKRAQHAITDRITGTLISHFQAFNEMKRIGFSQPSIVHQTLARAADMEWSDFIAHAIGEVMEHVEAEDSLYDSLDLLLDANFLIHSLITLLVRMDDMAIAFTVQEALEFLGEKSGFIFALIADKPQLLLSAKGIGCLIDIETLCAQHKVMIIQKFDRAILQQESEFYALQAAIFPQDSEASAQDAETRLSHIMSLGKWIKDHSITDPLSELCQRKGNDFFRSPNIGLREEVFRLWSQVFPHVKGIYQEYLRYFQDIDSLIEQQSHSQVDLAQPSPHILEAYEKVVALRNTVLKNYGLVFRELEFLFEEASEYLNYTSSFIEFNKIVSHNTKLHGVLHPDRITDCCNTIFDLRKQGLAKGYVSEELKSLFEAALFYYEVDSELRRQTRAIVFSSLAATLRRTDTLNDNWMSDDQENIAPDNFDFDDNEDESRFFYHPDRGESPSLGFQGPKRSTSPITRYFK